MTHRHKYDGMMSPTEAAEHLGVAHKTIKRWIWSGKLPTIRDVSGYHRIDPDDLDEIVESR